MQKRHKVFRQIILIILPLLIAVSCAPPAAIQPPMPSTTAGDYQAALTAVDSPVKLIKEQSSESEVQPGENINVWVDDLIEVSGESRALLNFPEFLNVELYRNAHLLLTDAKLESGGAISVYLNQIQGHVDVSLIDRAHTRVTLETDDAIIKTSKMARNSSYVPLRESLHAWKYSRVQLKSPARGKKYSSRGERPVTSQQDRLLCQLFAPLKRYSRIGKSACANPQIRCRSAK